MAYITIDEDKCNQDGLCQLACPMALIEFEKGSFPKPVKSAESLCIKCGHCVAVCPKGALSHQDMPMEDFIPVKKSDLLNADQCEQFLRNRRSIRRYKDKPVPRETLEKLIELASCAPSGHNSRNARWLVLTNKDELKKLNDVVIRWMEWVMAYMPDFANAFHMDRTVKRYQSGHDVILRDAPVLVVAHAPQEDQMAQTTCTIWLSYLELAAMGLGLGTCWAGYFNAAANFFPEMLAALPIPEGHKCHGAMMVGYPSFSYRMMPPRPVPDVIWR